MTENIPLADQTRKALRELVSLVETMTTAFTALSQSDRDMASRMADLSRRQSDAEQRAQELEATASEISERFERVKKIDEKTRTLIEALNQLPATMSGAKLIPGTNRPDIPLYGTYEWRAVVEAKSYVEEAMKERRVI